MKYEFEIRSDNGLPVVADDVRAALARLGTVRAWRLLSAPPEPRAPVGECDVCEALGLGPVERGTLILIRCSMSSGLLTEPPDRCTVSL